MPRKRVRTWPIRAYAFGVKLRTETPKGLLPGCREDWSAALEHVATAQQALWNTCVADWEQCHQQYTALVATAPDLAPLQADQDAAWEQLRQARQALKDARRRERTRTPRDHAALTRAIQEALAVYEAARARQREAQAVVKATLRPQLTALLDAFWQTLRQRAKDAPLPWYNARVVTESCERAVQRYLRHPQTAGPPRPKRALTRVHLTYHFTGKPLTWEGLCGAVSSMVQLDPVPDAAFDPALSQRQRVRAGRTRGRLRITDTDQVTFTTSLTRRPPPGSLMKGVELVGEEQQRPFGPRAWRTRPSFWVWRLVLVCEIPPASVPTRDGTRRAALDLNWRVLDDDRLRVGLLWDGTQAEAVYFPAVLTQRWRALQEAQAQVDTCLETCKQDLTRLWQTTPLPLEVQPAAWQQVRAGGLVRLWRAVEALPLDVPSREPTRALLAAWADADDRRWRHLRAERAKLSASVSLWHKAVAADLCRRYDVLAVEQLALKRLAEDHAVSPRLQASAKYRALSAPGGLLQRLDHTAQREGVQLVRVDPAYTTRQCAVCGALAAQTGEQFLQCANGHVWDQDANAARNLYERAFAAEAVPEGTSA